MRYQSFPRDKCHNQICKKFAMQCSCKKVLMKRDVERSHHLSLLRLSQNRVILFFFLFFYRNLYVASMTSSKVDDDVEVTFEDQKQINSFARKNVRVNEVQSEIESLKKELQNVEDAADDLLLLDDDECGIVGYKIGEVFINQSLEQTQDMLQVSKDKLQCQIKKYENDVSDIKQVMSGLKHQLYAKFGDRINLEA